MKRIGKPNIVFLKLLLFFFVFALLLVEFNSNPVERSRRQSIDEAVELISSKILLTRQKAMASSTRYRIHYNYPKGECRIYREETPGRWVLEGPDEQSAFPNGVIISPSSNPSDGYIEINGDGDIENRDGPVLLRLRDRDGTYKSIRISPSGMVQEFPYW